MTETMESDEQAYQVVLNDEEQYSIWPVDQDLPDGWRPSGVTGLRTECLAHIDEVWTDMRPLSLRRYMAEHADDGYEDDLVELEEGPSLVDRLSAGLHPVEAVPRLERGPAAFREALDNGYVFVRFTGTVGGTELGVRVDAGATDRTAADFTAGTGTVHLEGTLNLDFEDVRCVADIDLATFTGQGRLERVVEP
ncbi:Uncharacterized conserved protein YbdZ, MbtH family [Micromonospora haikouensis]|uniref:Uncharacterized conserved protein YbdZ, MbtH family n=1 Tax=Micromonospora haikouensis TaxID=686309 RepID=A0A1C4XH67_9ACTN|nr:Uncharacterized conserved protein YbdZ, MbtH family [Micromonospora haikouensis]